MRVKCLAQEHNTMSPARAPNRSNRSEDERSNHEATVPSSDMICIISIHEIKHLSLKLCQRERAARTCVNPFKETLLINGCKY